MRKLTPRLHRRKKRVSANIVGSAEKPRIAIHRSNRFIYAQVIDDTSSTTLAASSSVSFEGSATVTKTTSAQQAGAALGKKLVELKITQAVIDRGRFHYLGRVTSFVDGLRSSGIHV